MGRYRLNIRDGEVLQTSEAQPLRDLQAARGEALRCARRFIDTVRPDVRTLRAMRFEITSCGGDVLMIIPFLEALEEGQPRETTRWWRWH